MRAQAADSPAFLCREASPADLQHAIKQACLPRRADLVAFPWRRPSAFPVHDTTSRKYPSRGRRFHAGLFFVLVVLVVIVIIRKAFEDVVILRARTQALIDLRALDVRIDELVKRAVRKGGVDKP